MSVPNFLLLIQVSWSLVPLAQLEEELLGRGKGFGWLPYRGPSSRRWPLPAYSGLRERLQRRLRSPACPLSCEMEYRMQWRKLLLAFHPEGGEVGHRLSHPACVSHLAASWAASRAIHKCRHCRGEAPAGVRTSLTCTGACLPCASLCSRVREGGGGRDGRGERSNGTA